jgi:hypothetical protein
MSKSRRFTTPVLQGHRMYQYVKRERAKAQTPCLVGERPYMEEISYRQQLFEKSSCEAFFRRSLAPYAVSLAGRTHMRTVKSLVKASNPRTSNDLAKPLDAVGTNIESRALRRS